MMVKGIHLESKKTSLNILMISGVIFSVIIFLIRPECIFKKLFSLPCPTCGLTRAIISIFYLDFVGAFKLNILSIPLVFSFSLFCILYLIYLIFKRDYIFNLIDFFKRNYILIILFLIFSWGVNVVKFLSL